MNPMLTNNGPAWCPACATELAPASPNAEPRCPTHGHVVDKVYTCSCGAMEVFRAIDDVPPRCHYCPSCTEHLGPNVRAHLVRVVARSTPTTGPWRPA